MSGQRAGNDQSADLAEPIQKIYVPVVLLVVALLALAAWILHQRLRGTSEPIAEFAATGTAIVVKAVLLSLLAWFLASRSGGSFGVPAVTIMRIAALIAVLDAVFLWLRVAMLASGAISPTGRGPSGI